MPALTRAAVKQLANASNAIPFFAPSLSPQASVLSSKTISGEDLSPETTLVGSDSEVKNLIARRVTEFNSTYVVAINSPSDTGQGTHTRWLDSTITTFTGWLNDTLYTVQTTKSSSATLEGTHTRWTYVAPSSSSLEESRRFSGPIRTPRPRGGVTYRFTPTKLRPVHPWTPHTLQGRTPPTASSSRVYIPPSGPLLPQGTILVDTKGNPVSGLSPLKRGDTLVIDHEREMEESMEL